MSWLKWNLIVVGVLMNLSASAAEVLLEGESFESKGGWVVDTQFIEQMGSCYLLAHGLGTPVLDAVTEVEFPESGSYHVYVRTYNWTSPWYSGEGAGRFQLTINGTMMDSVLGATGDQWQWQSVGNITLDKGKVKVGLRDLTGFDGRCDAIYFTTDPKWIPVTEKTELASFRKRLLGLPGQPSESGEFDLVVVGGGVAGMSTAVSAARLGVKVALLQNRPILGGNNSSEVRVHLGGRIEAQPYTNLGNLQKEFGPTKEGNAQPKENYEDEKKIDFVKAEPNITLFLNHHVFAVEKTKDKITRLIARQTETGREVFFQAPVFADCTGDGTIGYLAGADFRMGREARSEYGESLAPEVGDKMTMGASVQWYSVEQETEVPFGPFKYGLNFNDKNSEKVLKGEWTWETGMNYDQVRQAERIRDYGMMVVFSNWSYLKNECPGDTYKKRTLGWVAYIAGKRESRRLLGDIVLTENDIRNRVVYPDAAGSTTWSIDLHYPDSKNTKNFPGQEFKAIAVQENIHPYPVPYRCLYSRNVGNLFMAGRDISVTHVALGTTRVMRTCGIMGEVVGMAASLCKKYHIEPRTVYESHLDELKELMQQGVGHGELPNNQTYNLGGTLGN